MLWLHAKPISTQRNLPICAYERLLWSLSDTRGVEPLDFALQLDVVGNLQAVASVIDAKHLQALLVAQLLRQHCIL